MSITGIRSNRGDIYQILLAFEWALTVLSDPEFQWLEIDSTTYLVDDVVIGKSDGSLICCQCKKNQADFRAWSIADLAGELGKASLVLAKNQKTQVRFYSRSEFGALAKLREYNTLYGNEADYKANLTQEHIRTNRDLAARIADQAPGLSTYEFLRRLAHRTSGSGKTCVMLSLQEALEQRTQTRKDIVPLFIQSREFADLATAQERQAQGLPEQWVIFYNPFGLLKF